MPRTAKTTLFLNIFICIVTGIAAIGLFIKVYDRVIIYGQHVSEYNNSDLLMLAIGTAFLAIGHYIQIQKMKRTENG